LEEGFDTVSPPLSTRMPLEPGIWRGDKAEIVSQQQGISPPTGQNMLRFLRDDSDGKPRSSGAHIADVYRLIDLREYRHELADGGAVVQASVRVNAKEFSVEERYGCAISIYALFTKILFYPPKAAGGECCLLKRIHGYLYVPDRTVIRDSSGSGNSRQLKTGSDVRAAEY
jgi:hypothetical protein